MPQSERLSHNATPEERLNKFMRITELLHPENIQLTSLDNGCPVLEDLSCGYKLTHNIITWEVYPAKEVADMIINGRNDFVLRKKII